MLTPYATNSPSPPAVFLMLLCLVSLSVALSSDDSRRTFLLGTASAASATLTGGWAAPFTAVAAGKAKGAAEYDFEYYLRDLTKGNKKEGNLPASAAPTAPPARPLVGPLAPLLLNDSLDLGCAPIRALQSVSGKSVADINEAIHVYREKAAPAFYAKTPWRAESVADQYYFDLTSYAVWRTAAQFIPDFAQRDRFARQVGREILADAKKAGLIKERAIIESSVTSRRDLPSLTNTVPALLEILDLFVASGFCSSYRLGGEDASRRGRDVFDTLDDEDLRSGLSVDCLVSVYEPAVLSASLQITGESSRFSPDFVGSTLAAMLEERLVASRYENYFVDPVYRPNPKDFFPNERLFQFTLQPTK